MKRLLYALIHPNCSDLPNSLPDNCILRQLTFSELHELLATRSDQGDPIFELNRNPHLGVLAFKDDIDSVLKLR